MRMFNPIPHLVPFDFSAPFSKQAHFVCPACSTVQHSTGQKNHMPPSNDPHPPGR